MGSLASLDSYENESLDSKVLGVVSSVITNRYTATFE